MPEPSGRFVLGKAPWDDVCAMESYVFGFRHGIHLLIRAFCEICLRYNMVEFGEQVFVEL
jgi:hypothetical protein